MRWRAVLALGAATVLTTGCGGLRERRESAVLRVTDGAGTHIVRVSAWRMGGAGKVVGVAVTHDGHAVAAQADRVSILGGRSVAPPVHERIVSLSRDGSTVATAQGSDVRVGPALSFNRDVIVLRPASNPPVTVLSGSLQRVVAGGLWELAVPRRVWRPTTFPHVQAVDPTERTLAQDDDTGDVQLFSLVTDRPILTLRRRALARTGAEIQALDVDATRRVAWLDRQGWLTCDDASAPVLPPAPPGLAAAVLRSGARVWALRGAETVEVRCERSRLRIACRVAGEDGDLSSAALAIGRTGVLAAGLRRDAIVRLPNCA